MNPVTHSGRRVAAPRSFDRRLLAAFLSLVVVSGGLISSPAVAAGPCTAADLVPQVRGYSINQGLSSYASLVRGKNIVFRLFLSRPACADGTTHSVALTGATLDIKAGAVTLLSLSKPTNTLSPAPMLAYYKDAPAVPDSTGDPKWVVDGASLATVAPPTATPITFEAKLSYTNSAGTSGTTLPITTFGGKLIAKTLLERTTPLRVLAMPMGDGSKTVSTQFGANARMSTLDGFAVLGRTFPLATGTADLSTISSDTSTNAGMRYHLNTNTLIDVKPYMSSGLFCDTGSALERKIAPQMEANLKQYNTANPLSKSADRVMGVIDQTISSACSEGMALVNGRFSYVRARYTTDPATNAVVPTMTGALMGMEQSHNLGSVPCGDAPSSQTECPVDRDSGDDMYHSQNTFAHSTDSADYPDVAYNLLSPTGKDQSVLNDRNVMNFAAQAPGTWLNSNTFLQKEDWALLTCKLGGPTTPDCALPVEGSAASVGAVATTTIVGTTDGTKENTEVFDSFAEVEGAPDRPRDSFIHLIQKDAAGRVLQDDPVRLTDDGGDGHHGSTVEDHSQVKVFSASFTTPDGAVELELVNVKTGQVLYERAKTGGGPRNIRTSVSMTGGTTGGCTTDCPEPSEMAGEADFGSNKEKIDFETDPVTGDPYNAGETVSTQYLQSKGVTFNDDPRATPKIIGSCASADNPCRFPPTAGTRSGRFGLWNSPDTLPVGPIDPVPDSRGVPLNISFVRPIQRVGMYIGNDDADNTTATLTAFSGATEVKSITRTREQIGFGSETFMGIDAGRANITSVSLDYGQSPLGEEIDDLIFERPSGGTVTNTYRATVTAEDDVPSELRAAFFAKCPASNEILDSGLRPDSVTGEQATFHFDFDATQVCRDGTTTTILVRFNDGYNQTSFYPIDVEAASGTEPIAVIDSPNAEAQAHSVLQHEPITLNGQGWDAQEGVLPGNALTWTITGPTGVVSDGERGNALTVRPPAGAAFVPGTYTAKLTVKNSAGLTNSTTTSFQVLEDKDNDGVPVTTEGCYRGNDNDPNDAFGDFDADGVPNQQDEDPCSARALYDGTADFDPDVLNYPSNGTGVSVSMMLSLRYRDITQVSGSTIRITRLGGKQVPPGDPAFNATGWAVAKGVGTAKFDRQAIINFLCPSADKCQRDQMVWVTIGGSAPARAGKPAFSFTASTSFAVQKG